MTALHTELMSPMIVLYELVSMHIFEGTHLLKYDGFCEPSIVRAGLTCELIDATVTTSFEVAMAHAARQQRRTKSFILPQLKMCSLKSEIYPGKDTRRASREDVCAICVQPFRIRQVLKVLPCEGRHMFHVPCIQKWVAYRHTCPLCREDIAPTRLPQIQRVAPSNQTQVVGLARRELQKILREHG
eukprot:CAMPEP_0114287930 /NCGR_PEP_ID=MMETSP0059-20121206/6540_1 /TAXON_ID=36894 /ORGANISM="Pyramimonas parkeae, Strain CCMP726" /LENGTH=185 /DNA_ID=CAMNT_0001409043 /DNA_START=12 /DNA_END=570 /DNA_ORIENTATION=-